MRLISAMAPYISIFKPIAVFFLLTAIGFPANATEVAFFDGEFAQADWTLVERHFLTAGTEIRRFPIDGNPDAFLSVENRGGHRDSTTNSFYFKVGATYHPAIQGEILQIDYSEDSRFLANSGLTNSRIQAFSLGILQSGETYFVPNDGSEHLTNPTSEWTTTPLTFRNANEFWSVDSNGVVDVNAHPDFSATGEEIQLGFYRGNSAGGSTSYSIDSAIDNWSVTITTVAVPEPSVLGLLGFASLATLLRRVRRRTLPRLPHSSANLWHFLLPIAVFCPCCFSNQTCEAAVVTVINPSFEDAPLSPGQFTVLGGGLDGFGWVTQVPGRVAGAQRLSVPGQYDAIPDGVNVAIHAVLISAST